MKIWGEIADGSHLYPESINCLKPLSKQKSIAVLSGLSILFFGYIHEAIKLTCLGATFSAIFFAIHFTDSISFYLHLK